MAVGTVHLILAMVVMIANKKESSIFHSFLTGLTERAGGTDRCPGFVYMDACLLVFIESCLRFFIQYWHYLMGRSRTTRLWISLLIVRSFLLSR